MLENEHIVYRRNKIELDLASLKRDQIQIVTDAIYRVMGLELVEYSNSSRDQNKFFARMILSVYLVEKGINPNELINRDRTTIIYYRRKFKEELKVNARFRTIVCEIENYIRLWKPH